MNEEEYFEELLKNSLEKIDKALANEEIPIWERPLSAATEFVRLCIERIRYKDEEEFEPGELPDYASSPWFRLIFKKTNSWYVGRYGAAMSSSRKVALTGLVTIYDIPFLLRIPTTTVESGEPEGTIWVCFHDVVQSNENVFDWLVNGPNLDVMPGGDAIKSRQIITEVSNHLRSIRIRLMGMRNNDHRVSELRAGIIPHLERAAGEISLSNSDGYKRAHWDIQMACELALKLVAQQRSGSFKISHDLFQLYDSISGIVPPPERNLISKIPNWKRMAEWRYGGGENVSLAEVFGRYKAALQIVSEVLSVSNSIIYLGKARFHMQSPPWMSDEVE